MKTFAALALLLGLAGSPFQPGNGATGFWITLWPQATSALVILLCGAVCAIWARNTGRSMGLWFFLGVAFSVLALALVLSLNAKDLKSTALADGVPGQPNV